MARVGLHLDMSEWMAVLDMIDQEVRDWPSERRLRFHAEFMEMPADRQVIFMPHGSVTQSIPGPGVIDLLVRYEIVRISTGAY